MSKRESLTESMRRYSNIVNEAEQLDENPVVTAIGRFFQRHFRAAAANKVAGSTVRQLENIQDLANSLARELGDDPGQWAGKLDDYFAELRQPMVDKLYDKNWSKSTSDFASDRQRFAHRRMNYVMGQFDEELDDLVEATREYVQDPYDFKLRSLWKRTATRTAKSVLEKIRIEQPAARSLPANHLKALYQELANTKDAQVLPRRVKKFLAGLVAFITLAVLAANSENANTGPQED